MCVLILFIPDPPQWVFYPPTPISSISSMAFTIYSLGDVFYSPSFIHRTWLTQTYEHCRKIYLCCTSKLFLVIVGVGKKKNPSSCCVPQTAYENLPSEITNSLLKYALELELHISEDRISIHSYTLFILYIHIIIWEVLLRKLFSLFFLDCWRPLIYLYNNYYCINLSTATLYILTVTLLPLYTRELSTP